MGHDVGDYDSPPLPVTSGVITAYKSLVEGMVEGTRGRGRKRTHWLDTVFRYAGMGINDCARNSVKGLLKSH